MTVWSQCQPHDASIDQLLSAANITDHNVVPDRALWHVCIKNGFHTQVSLLTWNFIAIFCFKIINFFLSCTSLFWQFLIFLIRFSCSCEPTFYVLSKIVFKLLYCSTFISIKPNFALQTHPYTLIRRIIIRFTARKQVYTQVFF